VIICTTVVATVAVAVQDLKVRHNKDGAVDKIKPRQEIGKK
jgi:hypothetical protein